jgi:lysophospholipase L1-like esterase
VIFRNVELHNIAEVEEQWNGTVLPKRVPEAVRTCLNPSARARCMACANAEIRFVGDGPARITLASGEGRFFHVAYGSFIAPGAYPLTATELTYELAVPENLRQLRPEHRGALPFDPHVIRVLLPRTPVVFRGVEGTNVRPPDPVQVPRIRYLAHGTSITEGGAATAPHLAYAAQTARRLGVDLLNLGMSGSCHAEKEMADHIASRKDWDIATLELSVNMMGFEVDEFRRRVAYMVDTVAGADPSRPVVCLTLYPYFNDFCANHAAGAAKAAAFRQTLRDVVAASPHPNVHLVEGADLLDAVDGLSADMIHPSDYGMSRIAEHLAARLRPLLPSG